MRERRESYEKTQWGACVMMFFAYSVSRMVDE